MRKVTTSTGTRLRPIKFERRTLGAQVRDAHATASGDRLHCITRGGKRSVELAVPQDMHSKPGVAFIPEAGI